jgi:hypothetical protein
MKKKGLKGAMLCLKMNNSGASLAQQSLIDY